MKPSKILRVYLLTSGLIGLLLTCLTVYSLSHDEITPGAALILPVCWNVLLMLILPLVLDWSEQKYLKARFLQLEDVAKENPELKACLEQQCQKLAVSNIRVAVVDSQIDETFSYGLLRYNPRIIVPSSLLNLEDKTKAIPSIENELSRFARQEISLYFIGFIILQILLQQLLMQLAHIPA